MPQNYKIKKNIFKFSVQKSLQLVASIFLIINQFIPLIPILTIQQPVVVNAGSGTGGVDKVGAAVTTGSTTDVKETDQIDWTVYYKGTLPQTAVQDLSLVDTYVGQSTVGTVNTPPGYANTGGVSGWNSTPGIISGNNIVGDGKSVPVAVSPSPVSVNIGNGGGDGFVPLIADNGKIYIVYHHTQSTLQCIDPKLGIVCPGYPKPISYTVGGVSRRMNSPSSGDTNVIIGNNLYSVGYLATDPANPLTTTTGVDYGIGCVDITTGVECATQPFKKVGSTGSAFYDPQYGVMSELRQVGTKLYSMDLNNLVHCFDASVAPFVECAGYPKDISDPVTFPVRTNKYFGANIASGTKIMFANAYVASGVNQNNTAGVNDVKARCFDTATGAPCAGWSTGGTTLLANSGSTQLYPHQLYDGFFVRYTTGLVADAFCGMTLSTTLTISQCFHISDGSAITSVSEPGTTNGIPQALYNIVRGAGEQGIVASVPELLTGHKRSFFSSYPDNFQACWDWVLGAICPSTNSINDTNAIDTVGDGLVGDGGRIRQPLNVTTLEYGSRFDSKTGCWWALGDKNILWSFDEFGYSPCHPININLKSSQTISPAYFCKTGLPSDIAWTTVGVYNFNASDYDSFSVTIKDDTTNAVLGTFDAKAGVLSFDLAAAGITYAAHPTIRLEALGLISPLKDPLGNPKTATFLSGNFSTTTGIQFCYKTKIDPLSCAQFPKTVTNNAIVKDITTGLSLGNDNESFNVLIDPPGRCLLPSIDVQKTVYNGHDGGVSCPGSENATVTSTSKNVTWCFVVKNTGTSYLNGVSVSDPSLTGSPFTNPILLAPNASVTIFKEGVQGATLTNTSSATGPATDSTGTVLAGTPTLVPSTNTATVTLANPSLTLAKTAILGPNGDCTLANDSLPTVANGATVTYCFKVTNAGDTNLINVSLVDSQVPYSTIIGNLAIGASVTKSIDSVRTTNLVNSATVTGTPATAANVAFPGVVDITATDTTTVNVSAPLITDPQITKSTAGTSPRLAGDQIISTIVLSNPAPTATTTAVGLSFTDPIPATPSGTTRAYSSVVTGGATGNTASGTGGIVDTVTLPVNSTITYTVTDTVTSTGNYQNSATLQGKPPVTGQAIVVNAPNVTLTKTTPPGPYTAGTAIVSTLTVQNTGSSTGTALLADPIPATPAGTTRSYTSVSTGGATGASASGTTSISETVTLPAGGKVVYTISDTPIAAGTYQNNATKDGGPNVPGNVPGVVNAPAITMAKSTPPGPYTVGTPIVSTLSVNNTGGASGTAIIADPIPVAPAGTTRTFTTTITGGATGATASGTGAIADTLTMPGPSSVIYTISDTPTQPGTYQNNAKINNGPDVPGGPPGTVQAPNIGSTKTTNAGPYIAGTPITSTVTVQNTGSSVGTAVVSDPIPALPAGTTRTYTSLSTGGATGATASGTLAINDNLTLPPTGKVVYTVIDTPIVAGTYQNIATVNGTQVPGPSGPVNAPDIKIKKDTTPPSGPYSVNVPITSTVTVTNSGTSTGTTNVVDNIPLLPVGTTRTFTSAPSGGATGATVSGTGNINDNLTMPAGSSVIYTVNDTPTQAGTYQNSATITGKPPVVGGPGGPVNAPNINTTKSTPVGPYIAGNVITSTITITNTGLAAGPATVSDPIPATPVGTTRTYTSVSTGGATGASASGTAAITDTLTMPAASKVVYTVNDTPTQAGTYQNNVVVNSTTYPGGPPGIVNAPNITSTKTTPAGPYNAGTPITSTITVSNIGGAAGTATVVDIIPASPAGTTRTFTSISPSGATGNTASGTGNINDTLTMPAGSIVLYTVNDIPVIGGSYQNTVVTNGTPKTGGPTGHVNAPNIVLTKNTPPGPYTNGTPIISTVIVKNTGDLQGTTNVVDNIPATPAGTVRTYVSVAAGGATGNTSGTTNINDNLTLPINAVVTYTINDTPKVGGDYRNFATVTTGIPPVVQPPVPGGPNAPVIDVRKDTPAGPYSVGSPITSTVTIKNLGTVAATGVSVSDSIPALPAGTVRSFTSIISGAVTGATVSGTTSISDTLNMPVGSSVVYTIVDTPTKSGTYQNIVIVNGGNPIPGTPGGLPDPTPGPDPVISIIKDTPAGPYETGTAIVSKITVENTSNIDTTGVVVKDNVPATPAGTVRSFTSVETGTATGNTANGTGNINDTLTMPGNSKVVYMVSDTPIASGDYQNFVTIGNGKPTPGTPGGVPIPPGAPVPPPGPVIGIVKKTPTGPYALGTEIVSTITVTNDSTQTANGVTVNDPIPATPAGTVRSFTSIATGAVTGNTLSGTTGISDTLKMPPSTKIVYTVKDIPVVGGNYQNWVTVNGGDPIPGTPKPIDPGTPPPPPSPVIDIKKFTPDGPYNAGVPITSTITVSNLGTVNATGVSVIDNLPTEPAGNTRTFTSVASGGATGNSVNGTSSINDTLTMPAGAKVVYTVNDTAHVAGTYQNFVVVLGGNKIPGTPNPLPPGAPTPPPGDVHAPNIEVTKDTPAGPYEAGIAIPTKLTIKNSGTSDATNINFTDLVPVQPPGTTRIYTSVASGSATGNTVSGIGDLKDKLNLPMNSSVVYSILDTPHVSGTYQNKANVQCDCDVPGAPGGKGRDILGTPGGIPPADGTVPPPGIVNSANIVTTKDTPSGPYKMGKAITSKITISNTGNAIGKEIHVVDAIPSSPAGTTRTFTSTMSGNATGATSSGTGDINDTLTMPAGSVIVYIVNDTPTKTGDYKNTVTISSPTEIPGATKNGTTITGTPGGIPGAAQNYKVVANTLPNTGNGYWFYLILGMMMMLFPLYKGKGWIPDELIGETGNGGLTFKVMNINM